MRKLVALVLVSLVMVGLVAGCGGGGGGSSSKPIVIGVAEPLTGGMALNGQMALEGAQLAVKQANAAGGINGRKIELKVMDDRTDPKEAANIANLFVQDPNIIAVMCHVNSSCYLAAIPIYDKAKLQTVGTNCSSPLVKGASPYASRFTLNDSFQGLKVADFMWEDGIKKIGIFFENTDYGRGVLQATDTQFKKLGGQVLAVEAGALGGNQDFSAIVTKFRNAGIDAIATGCNYNECAALMKQMRASGFNVPVYGPQGLFTTAMIAIGGDAVEGVITHGGLSTENPTPKLSQFMKDFEAEYKDLTHVSMYSTAAYDAMSVYIDVLKKGGAESRAKFHELYAAVKEWEGVQTHYTMLGDGDVDYPMHRFIIKNGKFELLKK